jgi:hypothetical protein
VIARFSKVDLRLTPNRVLLDGTWREYLSAWRIGDISFCIEAFNFSASYPERPQSDPSYRAPIEFTNSNFESNRIELEFGQIRFVKVRKIIYTIFINLLV